MAQWKRISLAAMRMQVQSLASLSGLRIWHCLRYGVGHRCGSDLVLLWCRRVATAPIQPLAWESLYAAGVALKGQQQKKKKRKKSRVEISLDLMNDVHPILTGNFLAEGP